METVFAIIAVIFFNLSWYMLYRIKKANQKFLDDIDKANKEYKDFIDSLK